MSLKNKNKRRRDLRYLDLSKAKADAVSDFLSYNNQRFKI
jgi:hypothetical protein